MHSCGSQELLLNVDGGHALAGLQPQDPFAILVLGDFLQRLNGFVEIKIAGALPSSISCNTNPVVPSFNAVAYSAMFESPSKRWMRRYWFGSAKGPGCLRSRGLLHPFKEIVDDVVRPL